MLTYAWVPSCPEEASVTTRRTLLRTGATAAVAVAAGAASAAPAAGSAGRADPVVPLRDGDLAQALDQVVAAGASAALAESRQPTGVWRGASGVAELGSARPVPVNGRFRIGSVTKTFVAAVVLQLVAERRLRLDDTIERWLPGIVPNSDRITVRNLLQHTSGVYNYTEALLRLFPTVEDVLRNRFRAFRPAELVALAAAEPPLFEPGTSWSYSNTNYIVLGLLIKRVTGRAYGDEVARRILRPLALRHTEVPGTNPLIARPHAHGYLPVLRDGQVEQVDITAFNPSWAWAAGEMISTAADLNRFLRALVGGWLLRPAQLAAMMDTTDGLGEYGLGLFRIQLPCGTAWGHNGSIFGYETWVMSTEDGRSQVALSYNPLFTPDGGDTFDAAVAFLLTALCGSSTGARPLATVPAPPRNRTRTRTRWLY
jgi:D-alanyl-D-alanine carboxypeptidase